MKFLIQRGINFYVFLVLLFQGILSGHASQGVFELSDPSAYEQVLVLSDVHGMYSKLIKTLKVNGIINSEDHWKKQKTLLLVLGDSIDKGDQSVEVLDLWIRLSEEARKSESKLIHLLGNHEAELLAFGKHSGKAGETFTELKEKGIKKKEFLSSDSKWGKFLRSLPVAAKIGKWLFCHSGFYPEMSWKDFVKKSDALIVSQNYEDDFLIGSNSILEAKDWWEKKSTRRDLLRRLEEIGIYGVIHGHQPKAYRIKGSIGSIESGHLIKVDTGVSPEGGLHNLEILRIPNPRELSAGPLTLVEVIDELGKKYRLNLE